MPDPSLDDVLVAGVEAAERFVRESQEITIAYDTGHLDDWIQEKLADERRAAGIECGEPDDESDDASGTS